MTVKLATPQDCRDLAEKLNFDCQCVSLDRTALQRELLGMPDGQQLAGMIGTDRPHLFSGSAVYVSERNIRQMAQIIAAIESVVALPAYVDHLSHDLPSCPSAARGVFLGYDFHLPEMPGQLPQLIEINTNAGGGLLNALLARAQHSGCDCTGLSLPGLLEGSPPEQLFMEMFEAEWRLERGPGRALQTIAIVDDMPEQQYLYPEFLLFRQLFERHGYRALICAPHELLRREGGLWQGEYRVDLVYNRLTDFSLAEPGNAALRDAWQAGEVVLTPNPRAHAIYADKRNLVVLCDDALLASWGVSLPTRTILQQGIPKTCLVSPDQAEALWGRRRQLFFKPAIGYGSRAAYRGDKLTRRVFEEIIHGEVPYIHQALTPPTSRQLHVEGVPASFKLDLRNYVYDARVQLVAARLWQGQTTNFRTPGGGFAPVISVPCPEDGTPENSRKMSQ